MTATELLIPVPQQMEHRFGRRVRCGARVHLSAGADIEGAGRMRNLSMSGAFIVTTLRLPVSAQVLVALPDCRTPTGGELNIAASVVRLDRDGAAVEWCDTPTQSICVLLGGGALCDASCRICEQQA